MTKQSSTRRNFLKGTLTATGLAAGLSLTRSAHAQGKEEIKIGLIGCGNRGTGAVVQCLNADPSVRLVALGDLFEDRIKERRKLLLEKHASQVRCPDEHCFSGFDAYRKVIALSDVVLIACATKFHPMYTEAAIEAGKHVFVEKPHAIDPPGIRRLERTVKRAEEKGLSLVSGLQSRWSTAWQETIKRIHDGEIGDIVAMQSMFLRGPYSLVARNPDLTEMEYQFSNWFHFRWLSGDDVIQSLVHNVDRMTWVMNGELPQWAFATAGRSGTFGDIHGDLFDHASVVYEYKSGARLYAMCRTTNGCYNNSGDVIVGTKATCLLGQSRFVKHNGEEIYRYQGPKNNPYQTEQDELVKAVKTGRPVNCGSFMCDSTMVAVLGQIAAYQGNEVRYDKAKEAEFHFGDVEPEQADFATVPPTVPNDRGDYPVPLPGRTRFLQ